MPSIAERRILQGITIKNPTPDEASRLLFPFGMDRGRTLTYAVRVSRGVLDVTTIRPQTLIGQDRKAELAEHFNRMQEAEYVIVRGRRR